LEAGYMDNAGCKLFNARDFPKERSVMRPIKALIQAGLGLAELQCLRKSR
jgi:hypothetical protein